jgi:micrococcal nuclease
MKRVLLTWCLIVFFSITVLLNLSLYAEDAGNNIKQENTVQVEDIVQMQDTAIKVKNSATVIRVIDGDTIKINCGNKVELVKLIGIDAPENKLSRKAKNEALANKENLVTIVSLGIDAANFMKNLLKKGDIVTLEFDIETRDIHGNLLGYVFLSDGKMLNEEIVRAGYANVINASPNIKYKEKLRKAYEEARMYKRGLWE